MGESLASILTGKGGGHAFYSENLFWKNKKQKIFYSK